MVCPWSFLDLSREDLSIIQIYKTNYISDSFPSLEDNAEAEDEEEDEPFNNTVEYSEEISKDTSEKIEELLQDTGGNVAICS